MPEQRTFTYRRHVKRGLHFFTLLMCAAIVAAAVFAYRVDPRPVPDPFVGLVVPLLVSLAVGAFTWRATAVWAGQTVVLGSDVLVHRMGRRRRVVPFSEVTSISFAGIPLVGGRARLRTTTTSVNLFTNVVGITELLRAVRRSLEAAGRGGLIDEDRFAAFLRTATIAEQRARRYETRYDAFPWLAILSPLGVLFLSQLTPISAGARVIWVGVFTVYPWIVIGVVELVLLGQFLERTGRNREPDPVADPRAERQLVRRGLMTGYYAYLALNLAMLARLL
jgi:hypothetical protein